MGYLFIGHNLAADFVNTEVISQQGRIDLLSEPKALKKWIIEAECGKNVACTQGELESAIKLRKEIRHAFEQIVLGQTLSTIDLNVFNKRSNQSIRNLIPEKDAYKFEVRLDTVDDVLALIALAFCDLLASPRLKSLRRCASDKCILFFVDTSKNQHRQWCSMDVCGNREKVKKHYERQR
jgi:predicted RNA-binding Zn ribbon-like protein